jgi:hypothetical protein
MNSSIDRLTLPVFQAAVLGCIQSALQKSEGTVKLSKDAEYETRLLTKLCDDSECMQPIFQAFLELLEGDDQRRRQSMIEYIFRQCFLIGWHAWIA